MKPQLRSVENEEHLEVFPQGEGHVSGSSKAHSLAGAQQNSFWKASKDKPLTTPPPSTYINSGQRGWCRSLSLVEVHLYKISPPPLGKPLSQKQALVRQWRFQGWLLPGSSLEKQSLLGPRTQATHLSLYTPGHDQSRRQFSPRWGDACGGGHEEPW